MNLFLSLKTFDDCKYNIVCFRVREARFMILDEKFRKIFRFPKKSEKNEILEFLEFLDGN